MLNIHFMTEEEEMRYLISISEESSKNKLQTKINRCIH